MTGEGMTGDVGGEEGNSLKSDSTRIREIVQAAMDTAPGATMLMAALPNRHGGDGLEHGAQATTQIRFEDGKVASSKQVIDDLNRPLQALMKTIEIDPKRSKLQENLQTCGSY